MNDENKLVSEFGSNFPISFGEVKVCDKNGNEIVEKCVCGEIASTFVYGCNSYTACCNRCLNGGK
jgi:hypothetical protein